MDASISEILAEYGIPPILMAITPVLISAIPKLQGLYENWLSRDRHHKSNKIHLEHLKLHLEVKSLARAAAGRGRQLDLNLPPLPPIAVIKPPRPPLNWRTRLKWCLIGTYTVFVIFLIHLYSYLVDEDGIISIGMEAFGVVATFVIAIGAVTAALLTLIPFRQRSLSFAFGATSCLAVAVYVELKILLLIALSIA